MSNVIIGQVLPGSITCSYHVQCAGCIELRELDMSNERLPIIEDSLRARAVRQGFHLMPFSPAEDKWFCTACAESRAADATVFSVMREQAKSAAHLKAKAAEKKATPVWTDEQEKEYIFGMKELPKSERTIKKSGHVQPKATKKKTSRKKKW